MPRNLLRSMLRSMLRSKNNTMKKTYIRKVTRTGRRSLSLVIPADIVNRPVT